MERRRANVEPSPTLSPARKKDFLLSVVIPCFNEQDVLMRTLNRVSAVLGTRDFGLQIVFVDDGSRDHTKEILADFASEDRRVKVVSFSRNFGHQAAVSAGLENAD